MESRNKFIITIGVSIIVVVVGFFILGLDKIIIKPLIKDYVISNISVISYQHTSLNLPLKYLELITYE